MARPPTIPASPSTLAPALMRWMAAHGGDVANVARDGASADADRDELHVTPLALASLLASAGELVGEPHVALRLPRELTYRRYDALSLAARAARSVEQVLSLHVRYASLVFPHLEAMLESDATGLRFTMAVGGYPRGLGAPVDEYLLALCLERCRRGEWRPVPQRIVMTAARPRELAPLHETFGTREIDFGRERCGFELSRDDAQRELEGHDATMLATAEQLASQAADNAPRVGTLREVVAARIEALLPNDVSADAIATQLHMSERTLQRRLESEATTWREVLDRVREKRARALLADATIPLGEVAYRAGFSDLAAFSRAFKRWTGLAPGAYRRRG